MASYAFWNNKGGVGKSFLCFVAASEFAHRNPDADVYVLDLCPQANVSETLLGGFKTSPQAIRELTRKNPRATVAGYLESRLNSPFQMIDDVEPYLTRPYEINGDVPDNISLICGDNLLEILSEAIRQTSQLAVPTDAWKRVITWLRDLTGALRKRSDSRETLFIIDCNPSFAVYTQLALVAADKLVIPFTADDSSRRAVENVVALLHGIGDAHAELYARISFSKRARDEGIPIPKLDVFVSNRVTLYRGIASSAFEAVSRTIKDTMNSIHQKHRDLFANPRLKPSESFIEVPDYHSACVVASTTGTPLHKLKAGPRELGGERVQLNQEPLNRYRKALGEFVETL